MSDIEKTGYEELFGEHELSDVYADEINNLVENYGLDVDSRANYFDNRGAVLSVEDTVIRLTRINDSYIIRSVKQETEESTFELLEQEELGYEETLENVLRDLNDFTDVEEYLNDNGVEIEGINDYENKKSEKGRYTEKLAKALDKIGLTH